MMLNIRLPLALLVASSLACGPNIEQETAEHPATEAQRVFLVSQKASSSVGFYSLQGGLLATAPVGPHPHEMVLSADGNLAFVADNGTMTIEEAGQGGNTLSIIDVVARAKVGEVSFGEYRRPHGIDFDPVSGRVLVTTESPDRLLLIDPGTRQIVRDYDTKGETSHMVTVSHDGKTAFVSNSRSNNVSAIDLESGNARLIPVGHRPEGSVLSSDGRRLYVANLDSHEITIIDTRSREAVGRVATGKAPVRVVLSPDGKQLIYALLRDKQVGFADVDTRQQVATVDLDGEPASMHLSADGRWALTAAQDIDTVYVISIADRAVVHQFKTAEGAGPDPVLEIAPGRKDTAIRPGLLAADIRAWFPVLAEWTH